MNTRAACRISALLAIALGSGNGATAAPAPPAGGKTTVYRCGQTYQQVPCPEGHVLAVSDARDPTQRQAALQVVEAEKRTAGALAAERRDRERSLHPQTRLTGIAAAPGASEPEAAAAAKAPHGKARKQGKPLTATDKTLYSSRLADDKKTSIEARMPAP